MIETKTYEGIRAVIEGLKSGRMTVPVHLTNEEADAFQRVAKIWSFGRDTRYAFSASDSGDRITDHYFSDVNQFEDALYTFLHGRRSVSDHKARERSGVVNRVTKVPGKDGPREVISRYFGRNVLRHGHQWSSGEIYDSLPTLREIKEKVSAAYNNGAIRAQRCVSREFPILRSRGRNVVIYNINGEVIPGFHCGDDCGLWNGTKKELRRMIRDAMEYDRIGEIAVAGGFDAHDCIDIYNSLHEPWVSEWDTVIWNREAATAEKL